jgi:hypothetical protein
MKIENKIPYWIGLIGSISWFAYIIFTPFYDYRKYSKEKTSVLSETPTFKTTRTAKTINYSVVLNFVGDNSIYEIVGPEYEYLKKEKFKSEILKGDTVTFIEYKNRLYSLSKNDENFMSYSDSERYKKNQVIFMSVIMFLLFVICLIPIVFENKVKESYLVNNISLKYNYIFYLLGVIVVIYVYFIRE